MCDFHEPYFGGNYPDGCCIDGYLWDLDSCDAPGGALTSGGDVPCPKCNHDAWLASFEDEYMDRGYEAREDHKPREYVHRKIRWEQPGDEDKCRTWWLAGWDQCHNETAAQPA